MRGAGYSSSQKYGERDLVDLVCRVVTRVLDGMTHEVTAETPLTPEHGVDSLAFVEIVELVESDAASLVGRPVAIEDRHFERLRTVGHLARYVADRVEGGRIDGSR